LRAWWVDGSRTQEEIGTAVGASDDLGPLAGRLPADLGRPGLQYGPAVAGQAGPICQREPRRSRGAIWAAITARDRLAAWQTTEPRRGHHDHAEPAAANIPAIDADVNAGELIAAQLP